MLKFFRQKIRKGTTELESCMWKCRKGRRHAYFIFFLLCAIFFGTAIVITEFMGLLAMQNSRSSNRGIPPTNLRSQLIDLQNFSFLILSTPCDNLTFLLVLIHSSPKNKRKRRTIRETWGRTTNKVKILFVLGAVQDAELQGKIEEEYAIYGDILQGSFIDSYRNMTYKHVSALKYAIYHCYQAKYVLKTDDDVFVNMPQLIYYLAIELPSNGLSKLLMCAGSLKSRNVIRKKKAKWYVPKDEYAEDKYPAYCLGPYLLFSPDVVLELYQQSCETKYFWIDDVYITGMLREKIYVKCKSGRFLTLTKAYIQSLINKVKPISKPFLFGAYDMTEAQIWAVWNNTKQYNPTSVSKYIY